MLAKYIYVGYILTTYIDANSFANPKELAIYLMYLDKHDEVYLSYFWWKKYYTVRTKYVLETEAFCKLCEMVNNDNMPHKSYEDINHWWHTKSQCYLGHKKP